MAFVFEERDSVLFYIRKPNNNRLVKTEFIGRDDKRKLRKYIKQYMFQNKKICKKKIDISHNTLT
tara:strand:- start:393 stop:587 length:195 start_codon:yes stop_codon:yes gene_type:complete